MKYAGTHDHGHVACCMDLGHVPDLTNAPVPVWTSAHERSRRVNELFIAGAYDTTKAFCRGPSCD